VALCPGGLPCESHAEEQQPVKHGFALKAVAGSEDDPTTVSAVPHPTLSVTRAVRSGCPVVLNADTMDWGNLDRRPGPHRGRIHQRCGAEPRGERRPGSQPMRRSVSARRLPHTRRGWHHSSARCSSSSTSVKVGTDSLAASLHHEACKVRGCDQGVFRSLPSRQTAPIGLSGGTRRVGSSGAGQDLTPLVFRPRRCPCGAAPCVLLPGRLRTELSGTPAHQPAAIAASAAAVGPPEDSPAMLACPAAAEGPGGMPGAGMEADADEVRPGEE
jgi:hypothetical protein